MPIPVSGKTESNFTPAPAGVKAAVCVDVWDLGWVEVEFHGEKSMKRKVDIFFQIRDIEPKSEKPFLVMKRYTASLHEKATLRKDIETWRGRDLTPEEIEEFDLEDLIGDNCQLVIAHRESKGKTYANIQTIIPPAEGQDMKPTDYVRKKDRESGSGESGTTEGVPDKDLPF